MRCGNCKHKLKKGQAFCPECGEPAPVGKRKRWPFVLAGILVLAVVVAAVAFASCNSQTDASNGDVPDTHTYNEEVLEEVAASQSQNIPTAKALAKELAARGFEDVEATADYDLEGNFSTDQEIDFGSDSKYPLYNIFYQTPKGNVWVVYVCNGEFMANPVFLYNSNETPTLLSEHDYIYAYEASSDVFIKSVPGANEVTLKQVPKIDASTLDSLEEEGIEAL